ncbi:hypothetical protein QUF70_10275 [Desulfobacterales bacterium HSG17]|nr:hypothetical protein [Desulfobacterales bacterium HSG17]
MEQIQETNTWITYSRVIGNRISVDLPKELDTKEVQIIIIPTKKESCSFKDGWKKDFQSISQWNTTENEIRMKSWPITEF